MEIPYTPENTGVRIEMAKDSGIIHVGPTTEIIPADTIRIEAKKVAFSDGHLTLETELVKMFEQYKVLEFRHEGKVIRYRLEE